MGTLAYLPIDLASTGRLLGVYGGKAAFLENQTLRIADLAP
jgi:hypothetical protein